MFTFLSRAYSLRYGRSYSNNIRVYEFHFLRKPSPSSLLFSTTAAAAANRQDYSFTVAYLINNCGFSLKGALSASNYLHLYGPEKPDAVINLFEIHGFTKTQISKILRRNPRAFLYSPDKNFLPKFEFFYSKGVSGPFLAELLCRNPSILNRSLQDYIIPNYNFLRNLLLSDEKTIKTLKRGLDFFNYELESHLSPKHNLLRDYGVPQSNIIWALGCSPGVFVVSFERFKGIVEEIKEMGLNPSKLCFVKALISMNTISKATWEKKVDVYKRWGWTMEEILAAFKKFTFCMNLSEDKIMATMDFLVNKLGYQSSSIARHPVLLGLSLKKRIIPRAFVIQYLISEGLLEKDYSYPSNVFKSTEESFLQKYVYCYDKAPQLLYLYKEKLNLSA